MSLFKKKNIVKVITLFFLINTHVLLSSEAYAKKITLVLHHFLSSQSVTHSKMLVPWAERLKQETKGQIEVKIFPSMSLGGKPPDLYRQVRDGTVDIIWTVLGYTPGVFQRSEVFELPTVHHSSAYATNMAIQDMMTDLQDDYKDLKTLLIHVHDGNALFMTDKPVFSLSDLKGVKIRTPSRTGSWMLSSMQAEPVGMPVPTLPQAMTKSIVEGALIPFEISVPLKLYDVTKYSIVKDNNERFGTSVFMFAMNKDKYESLTPEFQKIINKISGRQFAKDMAQLWRKSEKLGMQKQKHSGGKIIQLNKETTALFNANHQQTVDRWITEMNQYNIDGKNLVDKARKTIRGYQKSQ